MIPPQVASARLVSSRKNLLKLACAEAAGSRWAEFGVREGKSARRLLDLLPQGRGALHLFDSWEGLPEDWDLGDEVEPRGRYACDPPDFGDPRVTLWKGWFDETCEGYLKRNPRRQIALAHLDCDLYSSTSTVLDVLRTSFTRGTVLVFDDLFGYPNWMDGQWRAWREWVCDMPHTWLARTNRRQAAVRLDGTW